MKTPAKNIKKPIMEIKKTNNSPEALWVFKKYCEEPLYAKDELRNKYMPPNPERIG